MSKYNIDENLSEFFSKKYSHLYNNIDDFKKVYDAIKKKYKNILEEKKSVQAKSEFVKYEKYRLENCKTGVESNTNSFNIALFVLIITIGITLIPDVAGKWDNQLLAALYICGFTVVFLILVNCFIVKVVKYNRMIRIYDIAIKVLNDIKESL